MNLEVNKIHNGDAYELIKFIPDSSIDLIITDPPYIIRDRLNGINVKGEMSLFDTNFDLFEERY